MSGGNDRRRASRRRVMVLGSPGQWTVLGVGDARRHDRYRSMVEVCRVKMRNGIVGAFMWAYENPVHRPGFMDRASIDVAGRTWCATLADLVVVTAGPTR